MWIPYLEKTAFILRRGPEGLKVYIQTSYQTDTLFWKYVSFRISWTRQGVLKETEGFAMQIYIIREIRGLSTHWPLGDLNDILEK